MAIARASTRDQHKEDNRAFIGRLVREIPVEVVHDVRWEIIDHHHVRLDSLA
jgi:hypothetical protein